MALDHYVSQVHLRQFVSPKLGGLLYAIRKSDLKRFTPKPRDVCRIEEGSTNRFLQPQRVIEDFLRGIEPKYTSAVEKLAAGRIDADSIYAIAGFTAYVVVCSPGGMRLNAEPLQKNLEEVGRRLDKAGKFSPPPESLGGKSFSELLDRGELEVNIDPKFPQALGISAIMRNVAAFGNFGWEVLVNRFQDSPFFTSDYPVAIEDGGASVFNRIVPLTPMLAVRICPDRSVDLAAAKSSFCNFRYRMRELSRRQVRYLNMLFVRCAESLVFYRDDRPWVRDFVERNSSFRIEPVTENVEVGEGMMMISTSVITDDWK